MITDGVGGSGRCCFRQLLGRQGPNSDGRAGTLYNAAAESQVESRSSSEQRHFCCPPVRACAHRSPAPTGSGELSGKWPAEFNSFWKIPPSVGSQRFHFNKLSIFPPFHLLPVFLIWHRIRTLNPDTESIRDISTFSRCSELPNPMLLTFIVYGKCVIKCQPKTCTFRNPRLCVKEQIWTSAQTARKINYDLKRMWSDSWSWACVPLSWNRPTVNDGDRLCYKQADLMTFASSHGTRAPRPYPDAERART